MVLTLDLFTVGAQDYTHPVMCPEKPEQSDRVVAYDVYCAPRSDTCMFEGNQVERQRLRFLMPICTTEWCDMEFCYSDNNFEFVVGRNPDGVIGDK